MPQAAAPWRHAPTKIIGMIEHATVGNHVMQATLLRGIIALPQRNGCRNGKIFLKSHNKSADWPPLAHEPVRTSAELMSHFGD
jgi:hypothetical protein